jgi:MazG family protein
MQNYPGPITAIDPQREAKLLAFDRLLTIMDQLRENCPWDKKQTFESLRHLTIEETYELGDAILANDLDEIRKELGDIMLHIAFYSRLGHEQNAFDMADVLNGICEKLIIRHPHIYSDTTVNDEEDVKRNWELIKQKESKGEKSVLAGVPQSLPALIKAIRIQEKARGAGFDWDDKSQVWTKVLEELEEFKEAAETKNQEEAQSEFGDVLFSLINYARFVNINPEEALERTNRKFISRFTYMENQVKASGKTIDKLTLPELDRYWDEAKALERQKV